MQQDLMFGQGQAFAIAFALLGTIFMDVPLWEQEHQSRAAATLHNYCRTPVTCLGKPKDNGPRPSPQRGATAAIEQHIPSWGRSMRRTGVKAKGPATEPVTDWGVREVAVMARVLVGV